jgi:hypothetical protein
VYIHAALPAFALTSLPVLTGLLERPGVRRAGWTLAGIFWVGGAFAWLAIGFKFIHAPQIESLPVARMLFVYTLLGGVGLLVALRRAPIVAWPVALGALCIAFSYTLAPAMNAERSGSGFIQGMLAQVTPTEELALVAYKEQFLLYLDRPTVNFGHRRWLEGPQESYDASAWLNAGPMRVLLVPEEALLPKDRFKPTQPAIPCFKDNVADAGISSGDHWFLVRAPAESPCAALGDATRAIPYH